MTQANEAVSKGSVEEFDLYQRANENCARWSDVEKLAPDQIHSLGIGRDDEGYYYRAKFKGPESKPIEATIEYIESDIRYNLRVRLESTPREPRPMKSAI